MVFTFVIKILLKHITLSYLNTIYFNQYFHSFILFSQLIFLISFNLCHLTHPTYFTYLTHPTQLNLFPGLINLIGVIIFISAVTEESSSSKPKSSMDEPKFKYSYGPSFAMTISSFIGCQITGVLSVYLCIVQFRHSIYKRHHLSIIVQQGLSTKPSATSFESNKFRNRFEEILFSFMIIRNILVFIK